MKEHKEYSTARCTTNMSFCRPDTDETTTIFASFWELRAQGCVQIPICG